MKVNPDEKTVNYLGIIIDRHKESTNKMTSRTFWTLSTVHNTIWIIFSGSNNLKICLQISSLNDNKDNSKFLYTINTGESYVSLEQDNQQDNQLEISKKLPSTVFSIYNRYSQYNINEFRTFLTKVVVRLDTSLFQTK